MAEEHVAGRQAAAQAQQAQVDVPIPGASHVASRLAYGAAGANLAAGAATLALLQPGLPVAGSVLQSRLAYVSGHTAAWWTGWLCWHAAALALLGLYVALARRWGRQAPVRCALSLLCGAAGLAVDLGAQGVYMAVAPYLAPETFAVVEEVAGVLTGYTGNGLYTLAGILVTWAGAAELPRYLLALSAPVWGAGLWLSAASLARSSAGQFWSTAILIPAFVLWSALLGKWLSARAS